MRRHLAQVKKTLPKDVGGRGSKGFDSDIHDVFARVWDAVPAEFDLRVLCKHVTQGVS